MPSPILTQTKGGFTLQIENVSSTVEQPIVSSSSVSQEHEEKNVLLEQLHELIHLCEQLSSGSASEEALIEMSWGIGALPKKKKFSEWREFMEEGEWLLLEDISRQMAQHNRIEWSKISKGISICAGKLKTLFEKLKKREENSSSNVIEPLRLTEIEPFFCPEYDHFLLTRVQKSLKALQEVLEDREALEWLKQSHDHFKTFFRVLEVIGEAAKSVSENGGKNLPILKAGSNKKNLLWGKLRDQLYHNKSRSWELARLKPEEWGKLWKDWLIPLEEEVNRFLTSASATGIPPEQDKINKFDALIGLCSQPVKKKKSSTVKIENLKHLSIDKAFVVERMQELLRLIPSDPESNTQYAEEYDWLANQLLFFEGEMPKYEKNQSLKSIFYEKMSFYSSLQFSKATFENPETASKTCEGQLIDAYIHLKCHRIDATLTRMKALLNEIEESWKENERWLDAQILTTEALPGDLKKPERKIEFEKLFRDLNSQCHFISIPNQEISPLIKNINDFPLREVLHYIKKPSETGMSGKKKEIIRKEDKKKDKAKNYTTKKEFFDFMRKKKETCLETIPQIRQFLADVQYDQESIQKKTWEYLHEAFVLFEKCRSTPQSNEIEKMKNIFRILAFEETQKMLQQLEDIKSYQPFDPGAANLNGLRTKVTKHLEALLNGNPHTVEEQEKKFDQNLKALLNESHELLGDAYVQKELVAKPNSNLKTLGSIYQMGLSKDDKHYQNLWKNYVRQMEGKTLSYERFSELVQGSYLPKSIKPSLKQFLNGNVKIILKEISSASNRHEHANLKLNLFEGWLEELIKAHPPLRPKQTLIIDSFKIAYGIESISLKADRFAQKFQVKIAQLGEKFSCLKEMKSSPGKTLLLQAAAYDMQEIGELAQLISERPHWWNRGRHVLSQHHLLSIALIRKMMAHYPLILASEVMQWHLDYLMYDVEGILAKKTGGLQPIETSPIPKRRKITGTLLRNRLFEIKDILDKLNVAIDFDVLYPSLAFSDRPFLHPFGDLALYVRPSSQEGTKRDFIHAVMELELILSYQLNAKVCVIGEWEKGDRVNLPAKKYIHLSYLEECILKKQPVDRWISSHQNYELFIDKPWSSVTYKSGKKVSKNDFLFYHRLVSFFDAIGFKGNQADLRLFLNQSSLSDYICTQLPRLLKQHQNYSQSPLFHWVCDLFTLFSPPHVQPKSPILIPKSYDDKATRMVVLDSDDNCLAFLPPQITHEEGMDERTKFYYQDGERLDRLNGRSLLDPSRPPEHYEIDVIALYAAKCLKAHVEFIVKKFDPCNELLRHQFAEISNILITDPYLIERDTAIDNVPPEIIDLIDQEAGDLKEQIDCMLSNFMEEYGSDFCIKMLAWMEIDKKIEECARDFYDNHRIRLKRPFLELDDASRTFFETHLIAQINNFPFVNSFHTFINRLHNETLKIDASGVFSERFKTMIADPDQEAKLLALMKERGKNMDEAWNALAKKRLLVWFDKGNSFINEIYAKWDQLFRIIVRPQFFRALQNMIKNKESFLEGINAELKVDFCLQYQRGCIEREWGSANTTTHEYPVIRPREYFTGRDEMNKTKNRHQKFVDFLKKKVYGKNLKRNGEIVLKYLLRNNIASL